MRNIALLVVLAAGVSYPAAGAYTLIGWNDLGMHCMDGDYSVYAILPPYNTIHAQLIDAGGKLVRNPAGITVRYQAVADSTGSINKTSTRTTNFWNYVQALFGIAAAPDTGLTGSKMPGVNNDPQPMQFESAQNWFSAVGIPITPYDNNGDKNAYPMMRLVASDSTGNVLATTDIVLPVSDEMDCSTCHASGSDNLAKPRAGWANATPVQRDFKLNILRKHDEMQATSSAFQNALLARGYNPRGLYATVISDGRPILCAACHASNALGTTGQPDTPPLTASIHGSHASVMDFAAGVTLGDSSNRTACYRCHPGAVTRCLRGVMGNSVAADGTLAIQCQSCHGNMAAVGDAARQGWLNEPNCQSCHIGTAATAGKNFGGLLRFTSAFLADGTPRTTTDLTFATQSDVPASGYSLYRFSTGHGGLACEACHGSTHAEYPSSQANDNAQSIAIQGHTGVISECGSCHPANDPNLTSSTLSLNGPHGMHPVGSTWVSRHSSIAGRNA